MNISKERLLLGCCALVSALLVDQPERSVPTFWQNGLVSNGTGRFIIKRQGDLTLKYVTASARSESLELIPVPFYRDQGPGTESIREIARRFSAQTRWTVIAAINGGFFDTATGLPIGFLMRDRKMEFFNMPQGFTRSMVGFSDSKGGLTRARLHIASPRQMPKVWMETFAVGKGKPFRAAKIAVHHINIPGGKNALTLFTPLYGKLLRIPRDAIYLTAQSEPARPGIYRIQDHFRQGPLRIPPDGLVVALHGDARASASLLRSGALVRATWSLPAAWSSQEIVHGLLAGPRLIERGQIQVTAQQERLHTLKSRDRVALAEKANGDIVLLWAHKNSNGNLSYEQLAYVLSKMNVQEAIALDGGRSRAIFAQQGEAPADERYFEGGRPVANALVLAIRPRGSS